MKNKILALFLSVLMLLSIVSTASLAQEPEYDPSVDDIFDITKEKSIFEKSKKF